MAPLSNLARAPSSALDDVLPLVAEAERLLAAGEGDAAVQVARKATAADAHDIRTWEILARSLEAAGEFQSAIEAYHTALERPGDRRPALVGMARLAMQAAAYEVAERLLTLLVAEGAADAASIADLAVAQARGRRFDEAQATLTSGLQATPGEAVLWSALGDLLCLQGRHADSIVFFQEARRLEPQNASALIGLAEALFRTGAAPDEALELGREAVQAASPSAAHDITARQAVLLLAAGALDEGWRAFAKGADEVEAKIAAPRWAPDASAEGRVLFLGDADIANDLLMAHAVAGLTSSLPAILAVDTSWTALARRSFPEALVVPRVGRLRGRTLQVAAELDSPHAHDGERLAAWAPLRAGMPQFHLHPGAGTPAKGALVPDPDRVAAWREQLAAMGPAAKVGLLWRSAGDAFDKAWQAPSVEALVAPLSTPGLNVISVKQNGVLGEAAWLSEKLGRQIRDLPNLRRGDLDDLAALCMALDVVVGHPGVETYLAAACGVETWFLSPPRHWAMLGTDHYPLFPNTRAITADDAGGWDGAMVELGEALATLAAR